MLSIQRDWADDEVKQLIQYAPNSTKEQLTELFPERTWPSIRMKAHRLHLLGNRPFNLRCWRPSIDITSLPETEKAYIAGFLDGEGTISMDSRGLNQKLIYIRPYIKVTSTNREVIEYISTIFERNMDVTKYREWKTAFNVRITSLKGVLNVLETILPYLKVKKRQAELLINYCKLRMKHVRERGWGGPKYSDDEMKLFYEIRALNKKGVVRNT